MSDPTPMDAFAADVSESHAATLAMLIGGCWLAFHSDWSGFAVFGSEIDALRYAVEHGMKVAFQPWGEVR